MRYQIPQYIDIEDKLIFNLTVRQFLYISIPFAVFFFTMMSGWSTSHIILVEIPAIIYAYLAAFVTINGQKFNTVAWNLFIYRLRSRFYLWRRIARAKIFPEIDISLFHRQEDKNLTEQELAQNIQSISKKIGGDDY